MVCSGASLQPRPKLNNGSSVSPTPSRPVVLVLSQGQILVSSEATAPVF